MNRLLLVLLVALICHQAMGNPEFLKKFDKKDSVKEDVKKVESKDEGKGKVNKNEMSSSNYNQNKLINKYIEKDMGHESEGKKVDMDTHGRSKDYGDGGKGRENNYGYHED